MESDQHATGAPPRRIVQRGLWFEEFEVGVVYEHRPGRTVTEADNVVHHPDDEYATAASGRRRE